MAGALAQDFSLYCRGNVGSFPKQLDRIDVAGNIGVAVVSADHQTVFSGFPDDIRYVVGILAGHEHAVLARQIVRPFAVERLKPILRFVQHPGEPLRAGFDEAKAQFRKLLMNFAEENIVEGRHRGDSEAV